MKSIHELTAIEIKNILTEKNITFEYVIGEYDKIWIGVRSKTVYSWLCFLDENMTYNSMETYSQNTGKSSKGWETSCKVRNKFEKLIN